MPKNRLIDLCEQLINNNSKMTWTCYARADDLADESIVKLMKKAGAHQVQIGIESGNQMILDQMNKRCTVEQNLQAIRNCRQHGITTLISLIIGYPGETEETLNDTLQFMREAKPDFHFLATFSVRIEEVPMFNAYNKERFGLEKMDNPYSFAPYGRHHTMCCADVGNHVREMGLTLCREKISLDGALFYQNILKYDPTMRDEFLDYQKKLSYNNFIMKPILNRLNKWVVSKMKKDMEMVFPVSNLQLQKTGLQ